MFYLDLVIAARFVALIR